MTSLNRQAVTCHVAAVKVVRPPATIVMPVGRPKREVGPPVMMSASMRAGRVVAVKRLKRLSPQADLAREARHAAALMSMRRRPVLRRAPRAPRRAVRVVVVVRTTTGTNLARAQDGPAPPPRHRRRQVSRVRRSRLLDVVGVAIGAALVGLIATGVR
jgi:hypothetical protein